MPISAEAPWLNYYGAIPRTLNYPRLTIYQLVAQTARECPDLPAYEFMGRRTSYRDFLARIDRAALALYTAGIRAGDRVTICMPNTPQARSTESVGRTAPSPPVQAVSLDAVGALIERPCAGSII